MHGTGPSVDDEPDEFEQIARLYRPLTGGSPEALDLLDDVAVVGARPGHDLVLTTDAMVAGVHFLADEPLDLVARKLMRANLSDLAAKAAEPHGYLLTVAWPPGMDFEARSRFAAGLAQDQAMFGVRLLGGDTVSTAGPLTVSMTLLGWTPVGGLVSRADARLHDAVLVSGTIGDAHLGLQVLTGALTGLDAWQRDALVERHRLPTPRLSMRTALRRYAHASADVSDGLLADAGHIAQASGWGVELDVDQLPLSRAAEAWLATQPDPAAARLVLAAGGDDYEIVCTVAPGEVDAFIAAAGAGGTPVAVVGRVCERPGMHALFEERSLPVVRLGWTHP